MGTKKLSRPKTTDHNILRSATNKPTTGHLNSEDYLENPRAVLQEKEKNIVEKIIAENPKKFEKAKRHELSDGIIETKVGVYSDFIQNKLGTIRKDNKQSQLLSLYSHHLKLAGKAKEVITSRLPKKPLPCVIIDPDSDSSTPPWSHLDFDRKQLQTPDLLHSNRATIKR